MSLKHFIKKRGSLVCLLLAALLMVCSLFVNSSTRNLERTARKVEKELENRLDRLDKYMEKAADMDQMPWLELDLPEDMVVYRYVYDTLQSWNNQFPINNDDIGSRLVFQRLSNLRINISSPLGRVSKEAAFMNLGPKWYVVKSLSGSGKVKVIGGVEIVNTLYTDIRPTDNGVNKRLRLPVSFNITTIDESGGVPVMSSDTPLFKIAYESSRPSSILSTSILQWLALVFLTLASLGYMITHRTTRAYVANMALLTAIAVLGYIWGRDIQDISTLFSPTVYADGPFFYSFGAMIILSLYLIISVLSTFSVRKILYAWIEGNRVRRYIYVSGLLISFTVVSCFTFHGLNSLVMNSSIPLEIHMWTQINLYTVVVYLMFFGLMLSLLLLVQMSAPLVWLWNRKKLNVFRWQWILGFSILCAALFTTISGVLGFSKEQSRMVIMSNRLAVDRDLGLEISLRNVEEAIANDPLINTLSHLRQSHQIILNRLTENYLNRVTQNYDVTVTVCQENDAACLSRYEQRYFNGTPIADRSRFIYTYDPNGRSGYLGMFLYYSPSAGVARIMVDIETKAYREDRGYVSILGKYSNRNGVEIPAFYSYAKYVGVRLATYKGDFAYPTFIYSPLPEVAEGDMPYVRSKGYIHFINRVQVNEYIVISRKQRTPMLYLVTFSYLLMINIILLSHFLLKGRRRKETAFQHNYYRTRINAVLSTSLIVSLVIMTILSITFVYRRNEVNMYSIMSGKISTIQSLLEEKCRNMKATSDLNTKEFSSILETIGNDTKSDITLFTPAGKVFRSTSPEIFDRMLIGSRINEEAFYNIKYRNQRYFIHREKVGNDSFYSLYAPLINMSGDVLAIVSVPYTQQDLNFRNEAFFHAATIINIFIFLIFFALLISTAMVNNMFKPLIQLGRKMGAIDLDAPEYIMYNQDDEVSTLVESYDRMVHAVADSSKKLALGERDKAWSEMARQVAHEIKNPLTPIKLKIQSLKMKKEKDDPRWIEQFDSVMDVILEHVDVLTATANDFSTFAKLYTEELVPVDLDKTLKEQLVIFDGKDNIEFSYFGLEGAVVMGPKPQLIRVFVNLITNAVQAIESRQGEQEEHGEEVVPGSIIISLRNGVTDGFYDIVVEDNGLGVKEEDRSKLFTPNFTTKSSGTGLGLAICHNIVERCGGEISYHKSFSLSGACFVVSLPKNYNENTEA